MENTKELARVFAYYSSEHQMRQLLMAQLVNTGAITRMDLHTIFATTTQIEKCNPAVVALVYKKMWENDKSRIPQPEHFFGQQELMDAMTLTSRSTLSNFPVTFEHVVQLSAHDEYLFTLNLTQIQELALNKVIHVRSDMQRESEIIKYNDARIPCVKFSEEKVKEISENLLRGRQHPNTLRFHLIPDGDKSFEYNPDKATITIYKGLLANIDGNHRVNAILDALYVNQTIGNAYRMPIILTVGAPLVAREIIVQEEQRTPIAAEHVESFKVTEGNRIVAQLKMDQSLLTCFRFCTSFDQSTNGGGMFVESVVGDAIVKSFQIKRKLRPVELDELAKYIAETFEDIYYLVDARSPDYFTDYFLHPDYIMSNTYFAYGMAYIAAQLRAVGDFVDTSELRAKWVNALDLNKNMGRRYVNFAAHATNFVREVQPVEIK